MGKLCGVAQEVSVSAQPHRASPKRSSMESLQPVPNRPLLIPSMLDNKALVKDIHNALKKEYLSEEKPFPHLTELIYCLTRSFEDRMHPLPPTDDELMLWVTGFGLERVILHDFERPQPKTKDGISYHIDFLNLESGRAEMKSTRASIKTHDEHGLPESWLRQIAGYCHAEGQTEFDLLILYLMGNYKPPFPKVLASRLTFTHEELIANWQFLVQRKEAYLWYIGNGARPEAYTWNMSWECGYCRYKVPCDIASTGGKV